MKEQLIESPASKGFEIVGETAKFIRRGGSSIERLCEIVKKY